MRSHKLTNERQKEAERESYMRHEEPIRKEEYDKRGLEGKRAAKWGA